MFFQLLFSASVLAVFSQLLNGSQIFFLDRSSTLEPVAANSLFRRSVLEASRSCSDCRPDRSALYRFSAPRVSSTSRWKAMYWSFPKSPRSKAFATSSWACFRASSFFSVSPMADCRSSCFCAKRIVLDGFQCFQLFLCIPDS